MKKKILYGYQTVISYIKLRYKNSEKILINQKKHQQIIKEYIKFNSKNLQICTNEELTAICHSPHHNGIAIEVDQLIDSCKLENLGDKIIILDNVTDMGNLGAIIRSAAVFKYDVILPINNSAPINSTVCKNAAGGIEYIKIHLCTNLLQAIKYLKKDNYFIVGASEENYAIQSIKDVKYQPEKFVVIMGSEDSGIRQSILKELDYIYTIEGNSDFNVLNVSVAAAIIMFHMNKL